MRRLGVVRYADGLELQRALVEHRKARRDPRSPPAARTPARHHARREDPQRSLAHRRLRRRRSQEQGVAIFETGRGGDVTYHGPGQLVGYPILDLRAGSLRRSPIRARSGGSADPGRRPTSASTAGRVPGLTGAWVGDEKLAAIGVRIARWMTSHGFALNVTTEPWPFRPDRALRHRR